MAWDPQMAHDPRGMIPHIIAAAQKYGIDPVTAVRVAKSEGLNQFSSGIKGEDSWGAFQLNTQGGLGNEFHHATGLDPRDPRNEPATIDYALMRAARDGWGAFHGAKNTGIGQWQGIRGVPVLPREAMPTTAGIPPGAIESQGTGAAGSLLPVPQNAPGASDSGGLGGLLARAFGMAPQVNPAAGVLGIPGLAPAGAYGTSRSDLGGGAPYVPPQPPPFLQLPALQPIQFPAPLRRPLSYGGQ